MVVVGSIDSALIADQFFASLAVVDKWVLMVNAVSGLGFKYAEGGGVGTREEVSDRLSSFLDFYVFLALGYFYFFEALLEAALDGDFSFSLLLDFDFSDLSPSVFFFLLLESLAIQTDFQIIYLFINH